MALIHQSLYESASLAQIDFGAYLHSLADELFRSYAIDAMRIQLTISADNIALIIDAAIPCALLVNELVSNCLKHAFPEGRRGEIVVGIHGGEPGRYFISVKDNGVGLPSNINVEQTETLGLQLVSTLARQLRAEIDVVREGGTEFRLHFTEARP